MSADGQETWDLFCKVVDNYGDIGIAWRLARQLAVDPRRRVRLVVDRLDVFARIEPRVDPASDVQVVDGIGVARWSTAERPSSEAAAVVIEMLGCGLPPRYLDAMVRAAASRPVVWIDFEHLSAEAWVGAFHGLPSPQPRLPLTKHFFYPGFDARTGGLLVESGLDDRRRAFLASPSAVDALWKRLGVPPPAADERRVVLFAYRDAPVDALLDALADDPGHRWTVLVPDDGGKVASRVTAHAIPFVDQDDFDCLLWACDIAFVRGEDSFVRAQLAGRPFVWQIYPQAEGAHLKKLEAFVQRHVADMPAAGRDAQRAMSTAWNGAPDDLAPAVEGWLAALPALRTHAEAWRERLASQTPAITRLVAFVDGLRHAPDDGPVC